MKVVERIEMVNVTVAGVTHTLTVESASELRDQLNDALEVRSLPAVEKVVVDTVCELFHVRRCDIFSRRRDEWICHPRAVAIYLLAQDHALTQSRIAALFMRDHGTVRHALVRVSNRLETDKAARADVTQLRATIAARLDKITTMQEAA